jgi:hypothetical protein
MKKLIALSVLLLAATVTFSQHTMMDKWAELKNFHEVMSQTYHPAEKGDLKPIRSRAAEMMTKVDALQRSKYPAEFDNAEVKNSVKQLVAAVISVKAAVDKNATDKELTELLTQAHEKFHEVMGEKEEKHEHHDAH